MFVTNVRYTGGKVPKLPSSDKTSSDMTAKEVKVVGKGLCWIFDWSLVVWGLDNAKRI
jgi:hypothetical protein